MPSTKNTGMMRKSRSGLRSGYCFATESIRIRAKSIAMIATQKALGVMRGIATNPPITASTARISEMIKTRVVGALRFTVSPSLFVDERNLFVFGENVRGLLRRPAGRNLPREVEEEE